MGLALAFFGAALATGLAGVGSAMGISYAARTAAGSLAEDPSKYSKFLLLMILPGTQGIYGFIIGLMVLLKIGIFQAQTIGQLLTLTTHQGWMYFFNSLPIAIGGLISGIYQGKVCAAGINLISKNSTMSGKSMVMAVLVEFYAILGFLLSLFLVLKNVK